MLIIGCLVLVTWLLVGAGVLALAAWVLGCWC
jgi:hypothetical protein